MSRLSALGSRRILGALTMRSRLFRTQFFLLCAAATMVVPLGSKGQAATPSICAPGTATADAQSIVYCMNWYCQSAFGGACTVANIRQTGAWLTTVYGPNWSALFNNAINYANWGRNPMHAIDGLAPGDQLFRLQNMWAQAAAAVKPALAGIATGATAAVGAAQATGVSIAGAATTAVNTAGAAAAAAGNAVAGAGAATVVAGGVAVVGGAAVVTLTGMLAYESVRWRYATVESERLEVEACKAISRTNLSLYNHFLDPANGSPTRGQFQSYYEFNTRCRRHIESSIPVILSPSCT